MFFDTVRQQFQPIEQEDRRACGLRPGTVAAIAEASGAMWIGMEEGTLHRYDPAARCFQQMNHLLGRPTTSGIAALVADGESFTLLANHQRPVMTHSVTTRQKNVCASVPCNTETEVGNSRSTVMPPSNP